MKVSTKRDDAERLAKATASARFAKPTRQKAAYPTPAAENGEFVRLPESWLDRIQPGFPRAHSW